MFGFLKKRNKDYEQRAKELEPHFAPAKPGRSRYKHISGRDTFCKRQDNGSKGKVIFLFFLFAVTLSIILKLSPWPLTVTLRHIAAIPNCKAARLVGLAPAHKGEPGYYPWHDKDNDGIACEPWPR